MLRQEQAPRILEHFVALCREGPDRMLKEPPAWKFLNEKPKSTRTLPEKRIELGNPSLRLALRKRIEDSLRRDYLVRQSVGSSMVAGTRRVPAAAAHRHVDYY